MSRRSLAAAFIFIVLSGAPADSWGIFDGDGDAKISEAKKRAKEAESKERQKERQAGRRETDGEREARKREEQRRWEEARKRRRDRDEGDNAAPPVDDGQYLTSLRFAAYPYAPGSPYSYNTSTWLRPDEEKRVSLQISSGVADHRDGTWGNSYRAVAQVSAFHVNLYRLGIFGETEDLTVFSANVGVTFFLPGFMLTGFFGGYGMEGLESAYLSAGLSCQLFLPGGVHADIFSLSSVIGNELFAHLEATLEVSLWRLSLGAGWHHNTIAGVVFSGPCARATLWL